MGSSEAVLVELLEDLMSKVDWKAAKKKKGTLIDEEWRDKTLKPVLAVLKQVMKDHQLIPYSQLIKHWVDSVAIHLSDLEKVLGTHYGSMSNSQRLKRLIIKRMAGSARRGLMLGHRASDLPGEGIKNELVIPTALFPDVGEVVGRNGDVEFILRMMLEGAVGSPGESGVISIWSEEVEMGKTTVAQLIFNHDKAKSHFDHRIWVSISEWLNAHAVIWTIVEALSSVSVWNEVYDWKSLLQQLRDVLFDRKVLLVLDDMDNFESTDDLPEKIEFHDLLQAFKSGCGTGSVILMTTRTSSVAESLGFSYELGGLGLREWWLVFGLHAFGGVDKIDARPALLSSRWEETMIGKTLLPLEAKVLGGLLRDNLSKTNRNPDWYLHADYPHDPKFWSNYHSLPLHLKKCLAFCVTFHGSDRISKDTLIQYWMVENLEQLPKRAISFSSRKVIAGRHIDELKKKGFLDYSPEGTVSFSIPTNFVALVSGIVACCLKDINQQPYSAEWEHLCHISFTSVVPDIFEAISLCSNLTTLAHVGPTSSNLAAARLKLVRIPDELFIKLSDLKTLILTGLNTEKVPSSIGNLKQLCYLDLSHTMIRMLPKSTSSLSNLLVLKLQSCIYLVELPSMENMISLEEIDIDGCKNITSMPHGIGGLTKLHSLTNFIVGAMDGSVIRKLRDLQHLQGKLRISGLHNIMNAADAQKADIQRKEELEELVLEWSDKFDATRNGSLEFDVLQSLVPSRRLRVLTLEYYGGAEIPSWISYGRDLISLNLIGCKECTNIPRLGDLPLLRELSIQGMDKVKSIGQEFYGRSGGRQFPRLKILKFQNMPKWEEWAPSYEVEEESQFQQVKMLIRKKQKTKLEVFPCLELLVIRRCPKIKQLNVRFQALERLTVAECKELDFRKGKELQNPKPESAPEGLAITEFKELDFGKGEELQYPKLRELEIQDCPKIKQLEVPFQVLERLTISECKELADFSTSEAVQFPKLRELEINDCPKLKKIPTVLLSLIKLKLWRCHDLATLSGPASEVSTSRPLLNPSSGAEITGSSDLQKSHTSHHGSVPQHQEITEISSSSLTGAELHAADEHLEFPELCEVDIQSCPNLMKLEGNFQQLAKMRLCKCTNLVDFGHSNFPKLWDLILDDCDKLMLENVAEAALPSSLIASETPDLKDTLPSSLVISELPKLTHFNGPLLQFPNKFRSLEISKCYNLKAFGEGNESGMQHLEFLERLVFNSCHHLKQLPNVSLHRSMKELVVRECHNFESFPEAPLPRSLTHLRIQRCNNLQFLQKILFEEDSGLEILEIQGCPSLVCFQDCELPVTLKELSLVNCRNLTNLPRVTNKKNSQLNSLRIWNCNSLESFPDENGLPCNIKSLSVTNCESIKPLCDWGLHELKQLKRFCFAGYQNIRHLQIFELPDSLKVLILKEIPQLEYVSIPLNNIPLEVLRIKHCPKLASLENMIENSDFHGLLNVSSCPLLTPWLEARIRMFNLKIE